MQMGEPRTEPTGTQQRWVLTRPGGEGRPTDIVLVVRVSHVEQLQ